SMDERFLTGQLKERTFLATAADWPESSRNGCECEAYFYAGEKRLINGDRSEAEKYFEQCVATGEKEYTEYASAAAELESLKRPQ
ncbi:MAG TPA: hypothetical protein VGI03_01425, partial [Verrucomicrobiae bacterium]